MNRPLSVLIVGLALLIAACGAASEVTDIDITEPYDSILIQIDTGDVVIGGNDEGETTIAATLSYSGTAPEVTAEVTEGTLVISDGCAGADDCSVAYTISVPESSALVAEVGEGRVTIANLRADISATTGSGEVFLNTIETPTVVAHSGDGFIFGTQLKVTQGTFTGVDGDIDVSFDAVIEMLEIQTEKGDITVQLEGGPYAIDTETGSGSVTNKVDDSDTASNTVMIRTGAGSIEIFPQ
jgi:DUF4097 and DUF4098 domain-containing protein YvlB